MKKKLRFSRNERVNNEVVLRERDISESSLVLEESEIRRLKAYNTQHKK